MFLCYLAKTYMDKFIFRRIETFSVVQRPCQVFIKKIN
jgi:hypothetical protein